MKSRTTIQRLAVGDRIDGLEILGIAGEGGIARAYRVQVPEGPSILKLAKRTLPDAYGEATVAERFAQAVAFHTGGMGPGQLSANDLLEREAMLVRGLQDPIFPVMRAAGRIGDRAYVLYEDLGDDHLRARLDRREGVPAAWMLRLASELSGRHVDGRLPFHGDLKPEHIFFDASGGVRLIDPACAAAEGRPPGSRSLLTTPAYNPYMQADDRTAFALVWLEVLVGETLLGEVPQRERASFAPSFRKWLELMESGARGRHVRLLTRLPAVSVLQARVPHAILVCLLRGLGLQMDDDGALDLVAGYPGWPDFLGALERAAA
jgi:hypothetical protein